MDKVFQTIGGLVAVAGTSATIAYSIFMILGRRWLEFKFQARLETFRHEQAKELEYLRRDVSRIFSRISKIHEREFEVLPAAMEKLHQAYGTANRVASALQTYPELNAMSDAMFDHFMSTSRLPAFKREEVKNASDRNTEYQESIFWVDIAEANTALNEFHNYLTKNRIFMTDDLRELFSVVDGKLREALEAVKIGHATHHGELLREGAGIVWNLGSAVFEVERGVQDRLRYTEA